VATQDSSVRIRFYRDFLKRDFPSFPREVQVELGYFLQQLMKTPQSPDIIKHCQIGPDSSVYAYGFSDGYVVYWELISRRGIRIDVLDARKFKQ